jgi:hypothetical protein
LLRVALAQGDDRGQKEPRKDRRFPPHLLIVMTDHWSWKIAIRQISGWTQREYILENEYFPIRKKQEYTSERFRRLGMDGGRINPFHLTWLSSWSRTNLQISRLIIVICDDRPRYTDLRFTCQLEIKEIACIRLRDWDKGGSSRNMRATSLKSRVKFKISKRMKSRSVPSIANS